MEDYQFYRKMSYLPVGQQLDMLWHAIDADENLKVQFAEFYNTCKAVKDQYPKPGA